MTRPWSQFCFLLDEADCYLSGCVSLPLPPPLAMAGNIIPAIATTNAVIAGLIVLEALKILNSDFQQCRTVRTNHCIDVVGFFFFLPINAGSLIMVVICKQI